MIIKKLWTIILSKHVESLSIDIVAFVFGSNLTDMKYYQDERISCIKQAVSVRKTTFYIKSL